MNTCTLNTNLKSVIVEYICLLVKSEELHNKLEKLYLQANKKTSNFIKNQILKINNALNNVLVEIMKIQWLVEVKCY